jgi:heme o synthase
MESVTNISDVSEAAVIDGRGAVPAAATRVPSRLADFYELTKPRMNFLVVITTMVGFYLASTGGLQWVLLLSTLIGTALTAAGASVLNQYVEREHDRLMPRTRNRPLPADRLAPSEALIFGVTLGVTGVVYLALTVNMLTALLGGFTLLSYVFVYTPLKRHTSLNTIIGAVPGAIPPMMGFTAVEGVVSAQALALFGILFFWQLPHFLAIAIMYRRDYTAGGFRMLPCVDTADLQFTRRQILLNGLAMIPVTLMPVMLQVAGVVYFTAAVLMGLAFLSFCISCATTGSRTDAVKLFVASIIYLPLLLAVMMFDKL